MDAIILHGVRTHNLKNLDLLFPHKKLYVVTGVSGSGKSSLAFDTLYAEGQRRYVESLSAYARQFLERMEKPDADSIAGIPPAIAIEAKNVINNARSTVGTQTEINDYFRVFFARVGQTMCPDCEKPVFSNQPQNIADRMLVDFEEQECTVLFTVPLAKKGSTYLKEFLPELERQGFTEFFVDGKVLTAEALLKKKSLPKKLEVCADRVKLRKKNRKRFLDSLELAFRLGKGSADLFVARKRFQFSEGLRCFSCAKDFKEPTPNLFSFNSPLGACPECQGFGRVITLDWDRVIPDVSRTLAGGAIDPWTKPSAAWEFGKLQKFCKRKKIPLDKPWQKLSAKHRKMVLEGVEGDEYFSVQDFFKYLEKKTYKMHVRIFLSKYRGFTPCTACDQTRLKPEALWVKVGGKNIFELQSMSLEDLQTFINELKFEKLEYERVEPVFLEIKRRLKFLNDVGLGYLSLTRLSRTLSGGEVQRIHLATSLGSALVDTLYVLDEPSVGLHERDNDLLIRLLKELRDLGNTVVVVEHDRAMIEAADEVVDLGPMGGEKGGEILFQGTVPKLVQSSRSLTGQYLSGKKCVKRPERKKKTSQKSKTDKIQILGASEHNLKKLNVEIPLKQFVVISGVSGSGKSTLLYDVLYHHFLRQKGRPVPGLGAVEAIRGFEKIDEMVLIDQSPIGRTPRSNPATYLKAYDEIRKIFAKLPQAKRQGFHAGTFSFNVDGGRCAVCKGDGRVKVEMHFLADVFLRCEACHGTRFKPEVLEIRCEGKNIDDVLKMTIEEALEFFADQKRLSEKLMILKKVGLGYLRLGQSATTLSGGEAQRMKLAFEMSEKKAQHILYVFDEPTTGLHYHDIDFLMAALEELLDRGHSVVMIEHNMEVIRLADHVIDLGPEGGEQGGKLVYAGTTAGLKNCPKSYTGQYLKRHAKKLPKAMVAGV